MVASIYLKFLKACICWILLIHLFVFFPLVLYPLFILSITPSSPSLLPPHHPFPSSSHHPLATTPSSYHYLFSSIPISFTTTPLAPPPPNPPPSLSPLSLSLPSSTTLFHYPAHYPPPHFLFSSLLYSTEFSIHFHISIPEVITLHIVTWPSINCRAKSIRISQNTCTEHRFGMHPTLNASSGCFFSKICKKSILSNK